MPLPVSIRPPTESESTATTTGIAPTFATRLIFTAYLLCAQLPRRGNPLRNFPFFISQMISYTRRAFSNKAKCSMDDGYSSRSLPDLAKRCAHDLSGPSYTRLALKAWFALAAMLLCVASLTVLVSSPSAQDRIPLKLVTHPTGTYAQVNGAKLWYESEGQGEPLVLVPGGPGDAHDIYHPFFSRLADSNRVIYFDAFGVGKSDRAPSPKEYSFQRDVEDLEGLRKALGLAQMNLFGHSFGGMVAQAYALKYPQFVKRLILMDTFYSGKMWQANKPQCQPEIQNQYPEVWRALQELRREGSRSNTPDHQTIYDQVPWGSFILRCLKSQKHAVWPG